MLYQEDYKRNHCLEFLNRTNERHEIINFIKNSERTNEVIILAGPSGVGKSELVRYVLEHEISGYKNIRVNISINKASAFENNHYLNLLYKSVFSHFIQDKNSLLKNFSKSSVFDLSNFFRFFIDWLKNRLGFPETTRLLEPIQQPDIIHKKEFIESFLSGKDYIITIENFQNIDAGSLEVLNEIMAQTNNLIFIFEYTFAANDEGNLFSMINTISKICGRDLVKLLYVKKLDFMEAKRLISDASGLSNANINDLERIYDNSGGNLMYIILAKNFLGTNQIPIDTTIECLSKNARYLLGIMYWLETEINYTELFELTSEPYTHSDIIFSYSLYESCCEELLNAKIVVSTNNTFRLRHDSIITAIENRLKDPVFFMAYSAVKKYYLNGMQNSPQKSQIAERLFSLYIKGGDIDIINLLPEIRGIVLREKYPEDIIKKLGFLENKLQGTSISFCAYAYETLAEICHVIGMADQAEIYLNKIYNVTNPFHYALRAGILALKYHIPACQKELDVMATTPSNNPRLRIIVGLCRLFGVMMASRQSTGKMYAEQLLGDSECTEFVEYGLLLRNYAELIDDIPTSISVYERALKIFRTHNCQGYEADIYNALSMLYSYLGNLNRAEEYLQLAIDTSTDIEKSAIYNNTAVISILKGTYDKKTLKNLNNALLLNNYDYDKFIIKCNLLVYYCLIDNLENAAKLCIQIEDSRHERYNYDEFKHIIYSNLLFFSKKIHDIEREKLYTNKLKELIDSDDVCESVVHIIRANLFATEDTKYFYSKFPYRVDFLGNWRFSIDSNIAHT
jgi:tetratricopeptide (TPR) repeat protein